MQVFITPVIFIIAPILGFITILIYLEGITNMSDEFPTIFSLIYGPLSTLLLSFVLAGIFCRPKMERFPYEIIIPVISVTAAVLISVDISITNNRVIDSILITLSVITVFTFLISGFLYVCHNSFPWNLVLIWGSIAIFIIRIILWLRGS